MRLLYHNIWKSIDVRFSIIIATYNSEKTLIRCLESVFSQTCKDVEVLIKDGASTDNTVSLLNEYANQFSFYKSSDDSGVYDAWNECIKYSTGDWLLFLGSDDYFTDENALTSVIPYLEAAHKMNAPLVHGQNLIIRSNEVVQVLGSTFENLKAALMKKMVVRHPGCFHNRVMMSEIGLYDTHFKIVGDYDLVYRLVSKYGKTVFYPFSIVAHVMGGLSTAPSKLELLMHETYLLRKKHDLYPFRLIDLDYLKKIILIGLYKIHCETLINRIFKIKSRLSNYFNK